MVSSTTKKVTYTCNGTGPYPIPAAMPVTKDADGNVTNIEAVITDADGVESDPLTMVSADLTTTLRNAYTADSYAATYEITIYRKMPFTQAVDLIRGGSLSLQRLEEMFDSVYMHLQELDEKNDRAMQTSLADSDVDQTIPNEATRAGKFSAWNDAGAVIAADNVDTNVPVTAAMQTVLDDETIAAARTTMSLYSQAEIDAKEGVLASSGETLLCSIIQIGDWDMDATEEVTVAHGLTEAQFLAIRRVDVIIRNDSGEVYDFLHPINAVKSGGEASAAGVYRIGVTNIYLDREATGAFDSTAFDETTYNRGWITLWYEG